MKSARPEKVASEFKKAIYEIITRKLKNPFITEMISITDVDISSDMSHADVFLSIYSTNAEKKNRTFKEITSSTKTIRYELARSVRMRYIPELHFILDETMAYGDKMDKIFIEIKKREADGE
ncbi:MAG: 30S ribosome-binding factor RbfA [Clostridia bacterium]|nr:30S ribosome-binding factor RbfA [Clostridia bacterium]